jgi:hypothetical protein
MNSGTQNDIKVSLTDVRDKLDSLNTILEKMEPVIIDERLMNTPGIRLIRTGFTNNIVSPILADARARLEDAEKEPTEAALKKSVLYVKGLYKPKISMELKDATRKAFDAEGKGPEALAFFDLYKAELPTILMKELERLDLKKPKDDDWNNIDNYPPNHEIIKQWTSNGGNVGVVVGFGGLVVLDEDLLGAFEGKGIWDIVPHESYIVETGKGEHFYYLLDNEEDASSLAETYGDHIPLAANGEHIGDVKLYRSNVIAAGSLHPSGKRYKVINDVDPARITKDQIIKVIAAFGEEKEKSAPCEPRAKGEHKPFVQPEWMKAIPVGDLIPEDWQYTQAGKFLNGIHPQHPDSTSGHDFGINIDDNSIRCWRCGVGGGPVELVAVFEGIIDVSAGCSILRGWKRRHPEKYLAALVSLIKKGYEVPEDEFDLRPRVRFGKNDHFTSKTAALLRALETMYREDPLHPPFLERDGQLVRIQPVVSKMEDGKAIELIRPQPLNVDSLLGELHRLLRIETLITPKDSKNKKPFYAETQVKKTVLKDILSMKNHPGVPVLAGIIEHPIFRSDGTLLETPGYDIKTGLYYSPPVGFVLADRPARPTREDARDAAKWILDEVMVDFPYESDSDKVNALAYFFRPLIRPMVKGHMPAVYFNKKMLQTGGSKHSRLSSIIQTGHEPVEWGPEASEDEIRKSILSTLADMPDEVMVDNIDEFFSSHNMCKLLTSETWSARELGTSSQKTYEHRASWTFNGNNITAAHDLMLRGFVVNLDARTAHPEARTDFKNGMGGAFEVWLKANRGLALSKLVTIIEAWLLDGKPQATKKWCTLSEFNEVMSVLAGLCDFCLPDELPGFNILSQENMSKAEDSDITSHADFMRSWGMLWGDKRVTLSMFGGAGVFEHFRTLEIPEEFLERAMGGECFVGKQRLGERLRKIDGKRFSEDDLYITAKLNFHTKAWEFYMPEGAKFYRPKPEEKKPEAEIRQPGPADVRTGKSMERIL